MRLFSHFSSESLSNSYLVGPDDGGDAVLFDPATFDGQLLELVEGLGYYVRSIVLTHVDESHLAGLRTLRRVYECTVYATHHRVVGSEAVVVADGQILDICCEPIEVISMPGHASDSVAYHAGGFLFTGAAMSAGEYGRVPNPYAKALLLGNIRDRILSLPDETVILPYTGPPSTVGLEKRTFPMDDPTRPSERP